VVEAAEEDAVEDVDERDATGSRDGWTIEIAQLLKYEIMKRVSKPADSLLSVLRVSLVLQIN
jgi:hypothetical protein